MKKIFVSSTFKDMQQERDIIRVNVTSRINDIALKYGESFEFCDLRWGIDTSGESEKEAAIKVLDVCFNEIDRSDPPMIVIIGDRYGWVPDNSFISQLIDNYEDLRGDSIHGLSATALEIEYGAFLNKKRLQNTFFYFRKIINVEEVPEEYIAFDENEIKAVETLKKKISEHTEKIYEYNVIWDNKLQSFREKDLIVLEEKIVEDILNYYVNSWNKRKTEIFYKQKELFNSLISDKNLIFSAREEECNQICKVIENNEVVCIHGVTGIGKTTLLCKIHEIFNNNNWYVITIFAGYTRILTTVYDTLKYIVYDIENYLNLSHIVEDIDQNPQTNKNWSIIDDLSDKVNHSFFMAIKERLEELFCIANNRDKKILIILDSVDELYEDEYRNKMFFIPDSLSKNIHICYSYNENRVNSKKIKKGYNIKLGKIGNNDKERMLKSNLNGKGFSDEIYTKIIGMNSSDIPLYLSMLISRFNMMTASDYSKIREKGNDNDAIKERQMEILRECPQSIVDMTMYLLKEIGKKTDANFVTDIVSYIAVSQNGLRKKDLHALLKTKKIQWKDIYFSILTNLLGDLFSVKADSRYDYLHSTIKETLIKRIDDLATYEKKLLNYLKTLPNEDEVRREEIIWLAIRCNDYKFLVKYISDNCHYMTMYPGIVKIISPEIMRTNMIVASKQFSQICFKFGEDVLFKLIELSFQMDKGKHYPMICVFLSSYLIESLISNKKIMLDIANYSLDFSMRIRGKGNETKQKKNYCLFLCNQMLADVYELLYSDESSDKELFYRYETIKSLNCIISQFENSIPLEYVLKLVDVENRISKVYLLYGNDKKLQQAGAIFEKSLQRCRDLYDNFSNNDKSVELIQLLSGCYYNYAIYNEMLGTYESNIKALQQLNEAYSILKSMYNEISVKENILYPEMLYNLSLIGTCIAEIESMYSLCSENKIIDDFNTAIKYASDVKKVLRDFKTTKRWIDARVKYLYYIINNKVETENLLSDISILEEDIQEFNINNNSKISYKQFLTVEEMKANYFYLNNEYDQAKNLYNDIKVKCEKYIVEDYDYNIVKILVRSLCRIAEIISLNEKKKYYKVVNKLYDKALEYSQDMYTKFSLTKTMYVYVEAYYYKITGLLNMYNSNDLIDQIEITDLNAVTKYCELLYGYHYSIKNTKKYLYFFYIIDAFHPRGEKNINKAIEFAQSSGQNQDDINNVRKKMGSRDNQSKQIMYVEKYKFKCKLNKIVKTNEKLEIMIERMERLLASYNKSDTYLYGDLIVTAYLKILKKIWGDNRRLAKEKEGINLYIVLKILSFLDGTCVKNRTFIIRCINNSIEYINSEISPKNNLGLSEKDFKKKRKLFRVFNTILSIHCAVYKQDIDSIKQICYEKNTFGYIGLQIYCYEIAEKNGINEYFQNYFNKEIFPQLKKQKIHIDDIFDSLYGVYAEARYNNKILRYLLYDDKLNYIKITLKNYYRVKVGEKKARELLFKNLIFINRFYDEHILVNFEVNISEFKDINKFIFDFNFIKNPILEKYINDIII